MRIRLMALAFAVLLACLSGPAHAAEQLPGVQVLHRFRRASTPVAPRGLTRSPAGGVVLITESSRTSHQMVARVAPDGRVIPLVNSADFSTGFPASLALGRDGRYYGTWARGGGVVFRLDEAGGLEVLPEYPSSEPVFGSGLFPANGNVAGQVARFDSGTFFFETFLIDPAGQVITDVYRTPWPVVTIAPDGQPYGNGIDRIESLQGALAFAADGTQFVDVIAQADGWILALQAGADSCQVLRIAPGHAESRWQSSEPYCGSLATAPRRFKDDGAGGVLVVTPRSILRIATGGVVTPVVTLPVGSPFGFADVERLVNGRIWALSSSGGIYRGGVLLDVTSGNPAVITHFAAGNADGAIPTGGLVVPGDGFLYGTTSAGGLHDCGTIYRTSTDGRRFEVLYTFTGGGDGCSPAGLVVAGDGALMGTTRSGVNRPSTIFRVGRSGALTTLHVFRNVTHGVHASRLVRGPGGHLYGRADSGGLHGGGTAYRVTTAGEFTVLHHFGPADGLPTGLVPGFGSAPFVAASDGSLYTVLNACELLFCPMRPKVFRMTPAGDVSLVATLDRPFVGLNWRNAELTLEGPDRQLYGIASGGAEVGFTVSPDGARASVLAYDPLALRAAAVEGTRVLAVAREFLNPGTDVRLVTVSPGRVNSLAQLGSGYVPMMFEGPELAAAADGAIYGTINDFDSQPALGLVFRSVLGPPAPTGLRLTIVR